MMDRVSVSDGKVDWGPGTGDARFLSRGAGRGRETTREIVYVLGLCSRENPFYWCRSTPMGGDAVRYVEPRNGWYILASGGLDAFRFLPSPRRRNKTKPATTQTTKTAPRRISAPGPEAGLEPGPRPRP